MQPIDHAQFLDRLFEILSLGRAGGSVTPAQDGRALAESQTIRSMAEVYGADGRLLAALAADLQAAGDDATAQMLRRLDQALAEGSLDLPPPPMAAARLTGFVYPVV